MDLKQFKIEYQDVLDSGRDPESVQMNHSDAKTVCDQFDVVWGWEEDETHQLYGMKVIVNDCIESGSLMFGGERSGIYPGNGEPRDNV